MSIIKKSIKNLSINLDLDLNYINGLVDKHGLSTSARILGYNTDNYDNLILAGRIIIYLTQEKLGTSLLLYLERMVNHLDKDVINFYKENIEQLQMMITNRNSLIDLDHDWVSANCLIKTYLTKMNYDSDEVIETPLQMYLRIAVATYYKSEYNLISKLNYIQENFNDLADQLYMPSSPIIFNSGLKNGQLASCFLITVEDSLKSIHQDGLYPSAVISKNVGATGIDVSRLRHSRISNKGYSKGLVPWLHLYNSNIRAVNQAGKRAGACTVYCRPHHIDIYEFCEMSLKDGDHNSRGHDLNYAIWFPWLFWERVKNDADWTLMCPNETKRLNDIWGLEWEKEYVLYEKQTHNENCSKMNRRVVKARGLLEHIVSIQQKTGMPYILHGDAVNFKSNQKNLGYIRCSNLCLEICEYSSLDEIPSCNLSSVSLKAFVIPEKQTIGYSQININNINKYYDFKQLGKLTRRLVQRLNIIIDNNYYPLDKIEKSNLKNRPLGIGVSGFAEVLYKLKLSINSTKNDTLNPIVKKLNKMIFACMYFNALIASMELGINEGSYETFKDSPLSHGKFQFDLWKDEYLLLESLDRIDPKIRREEDDIPINPNEWGQFSFNIGHETLVATWENLRELIEVKGIRNSLLLALMPTATSAQPLRNSETCELPQSNLYARKIMNGAYPVLNSYLVNDLKKIGLWNNKTLDLLQADSGSISKLKKYIQEYPQHYPAFQGEFESLNKIVSIYKTMWETSSKIFLQLAADRGRYICQSQSTNVYIKDPSSEQIMALHQYTNRLGLKTGMYYLRVNPGVDALKVTVDLDIINFVDYKNNINKDYQPADDKNLEYRLIQNKNKIVECNDEVCIVCQ